MKKRSLWLALLLVLIVPLVLSQGLSAESGDELGRLPVTVTVVPGPTVIFWNDEAMSYRAESWHLGSEREQWTISQVTLYVTSRRDIGVIMDVVGVPPGAVTFSPETIAMETGVVYEVVMTIRLDLLGEYVFDIVPREL